MTPAATKARIDSTKERFEQCRVLDAKLHVNADAATKASYAYFTDREFERCEEAYDAALDYLHEQLEEILPLVDASVNVSRAVDFPSHAALNLPKVTLPNFDGSYEKWESFRDRFYAMIICETSLSPVQRLHHLLSCLRGEASASIEHLALTSENFDVAWQILSSRFENKRRLISTHLNKLFTLPNVTAKSAPEMRALRDKVNAAIAALRNLARPVDQWSDILVFLITQKLDQSSREAWELKLGSSVYYPTYAEIDAFMDARIRALDSILPYATEKPTDFAAKIKSKSKAIASHTASATKLSCPVCAAPHLLYQCSEFLNKTPSQRHELVKRCKRCLNCFSAKHQAKECTSPHTCKQCQKKHHTLLHFPDNTQSAADAPTSPPKIEASTVDVVSHVVAKSISPTQPIFLVTARVRVYSEQGRFHTVRALIDQGSAASFMTENLGQSLRIPKVRTSINVTGIGETHTSVRQAALITISPSASNTPAYSIAALILKSLTRYLPNRRNVRIQWPHLKDLNLADRDFAGSDRIDVLIGADLFGSLILDGVSKGAANEPIAQNTVLGWIVSGPTEGERHDQRIDVHHASVDEDLDYNIQRFWEVEEIPHTAQLTPEDQACEDHFLRTHYRNPDGRYVVRLPFKKGPHLNRRISPLGPSKLPPIGRPPKAGILNTDIIIEKGTPIYISLYGLGVDPRFWDEPEVYNTDRFAEGNAIPDTYMTFGMGPRMCV
ncbi:uncharacterized protein, partial [Temnothorax nylanderi]|uniref:uncharacterized protein n=1 Tax=Temnothorax nylanderi TaxID=102681 RepID=UPI003A86F9B6